MPKNNTTPGPLPQPPPRLSTITRADKIVVMDSGRIVESGAHAGLLEKRGRYFELYTLALAGPAAGGKH